MKKCKICDQNAELVLDGETRIVKSYSATFDKVKPI